MKHIVKLIAIILVSFTILNIANAQATSPEFNIPATAQEYPATLWTKDVRDGINVIVFDSPKTTEAEMIATWNKAHPTQQYRLANHAERGNYVIGDGEPVEAIHAAADMINGKGRPNGTSAIATWVVRIQPVKK